MVALYCTKYNERPQLGQVLEITKDQATIKWFDGTWSTRWKVYNYVHRRQTVAWVESLPVNSIIKGNIKLTSSGQLPKHTKEILKQMYDQLDK